MKKYYFFALIIFMFIYNACEKSTDPAQLTYKKNTFYVDVKDQNGNTVEGVGLHFYVDLLSNPINMHEKPVTVSSVGLLDFYSVFYSPDSVKLIWQTSQEHNNAGFEINRSTNESTYNLVSSYQTKGRVVHKI